MAVLSLAQEFSLSVVFINKIDSLFGACLHGDGGALTHQGAITKPMFKVDGPHSSSQDRMVVVIRATNIHSIQMAQH